MGGRAASAGARRAWRTRSCWGKGLLGGGLSEAGMGRGASQGVCLPAAVQALTKMACMQL